IRAGGADGVGAARRFTREKRPALPLDIGLGSWDRILGLDDGSHAALRRTRRPKRVRQSASRLVSQLDAEALRHAIQRPAVNAQ
ncbi:MAG: hypothetical protein CFK52_15395, partial [Chloracidobacterium sp. CP2_5A]